MKAPWTRANNAVAPLGRESGKLPRRRKRSSSVSRPPRKEVLDEFHKEKFSKKALCGRGTDMRQELIVVSQALSVAFDLGGAAMWWWAARVKPLEFSTYEEADKAPGVGDYD